MNAPIVVIGAGMGGLAAALRLARRGHRVEVFEACEGAGGLAAGVTAGGFEFDAGPYVLLDRPGLEWAFAELGCDLARELELVRIEDVYEVAIEDGEPIRFHADLDRTATDLDRRWNGSGKKYVEFVGRMHDAYEHVRPLLFHPKPGLKAIARTGAWSEIPFLLRTLDSVLKSSDLPHEITDAIAIWTFVAGQRTRRAPSPLAFVPALIHSSGAWYPRRGIRAIPRVLAEHAVRAGVKFRFGVGIERIRQRAGKVEGVETKTGEFVAASTVISNYNGVGTYLEMCDGVSSSAREKLGRLELQSPGFCAYLRTRATPRAPYLRFRIGSSDARCRLLVAPGAILGDSAGTSGATVIGEIPDTIPDSVSGATRGAVPDKSPSTIGAMNRDISHAGAMNRDISNAGANDRDISNAGAMNRDISDVGTIDRDISHDGWWPQRFIAPIAHEEVEILQPDEQRAHFDGLLDESWWRDEGAEIEVLSVRTPRIWGREHHLHRDSMNPVMTARFMRAGRLAHKSPYLEGLYLAGSSTHPGQWVSLCAMSGIFAADALHADLERC